MTLNFILVAMDQVVNHAAKIGAMFGGEVRCPLVIRTPNGAGNQLTAQHSQSFDQWFAHVPGLKVVAPATPADAKGLLKAAIRDDDPVLVIENLPIYKQKGEVPLDPEFVDADRPAPTSPREGTDLTPDRPLVRHRARLAVAERLAESHGLVDRGRRPALAAPARRRDRRRLGRQDQPRGLRRGGLGRPTGSRPRSPPASSAPASTTSTRRSSGSGWPRCRCPTPRTSRPRRSRPRTGSPPRSWRRSAGAVSDIVMPRLSDSMEEGTVAQLDEVGRRRGRSSARSWSRSRPTRRTWCSRPTPPGR